MVAMEIGLADNVALLVDSAKTLGGSIARGFVEGLMVDRLVG